MLWRVALLIAPVCAFAGILPELAGPTTKRVSVAPLTVSDKGVWDEYGFTEAETARYEGNGKALTLSAWRLKDPTGAQAVFRWLKPADAKPGSTDALTYTKFAATIKDGQLMTFGNYVLRFEGRNPNLDELKLFLFQLPKVDQSSNPPLLEYVPTAGMIPATDRYISGPASLEKFFNKVSPSAAAFHFGTEALVAKYKGRGSDIEMAVFYYPGNSMARDQMPEFQKVQGALVKRSGPLLAVVIAPANADDAQRTLAMVNYKANVTFSEPNPGADARKFGDMMVSSFVLVGLLLTMGLLAGGMVFGMRYLRRRGPGGSDDAMTMLHLGDH